MVVLATTVLLSAGTTSAHAAMRQCGSRFVDPTNGGYAWIFAKVRVQNVDCKQGARILAGYAMRDTPGALRPVRGWKCSVPTYRGELASRIDCRKGTHRVTGYPDGTAG